jgi:acetolactate synthase-1/2/3 large subunit
MKIKLSDYVMQTIRDEGVRAVFLVPGGAAMHLNDSLGKCEGLDFVCALHEQGAAIAAEGYARVAHGLGACMVTAGPGGTNAVTGVAGAWLDSTPVIFLSGQVKSADLKNNEHLRQLGVQELDIVSIVRPITKYAVTVTDPSTIRYHLETAIHIARTARSGPVWLDLPLDVQAAMVDPDEMKPGNTATPPCPSLSDEITRAIALLNAAERPVVLAGNGIHLAHAWKEFQELTKHLNAPVLTTILGMDLIGDSDPLFAGRPGANASRGANFTLQNSDLLLVLGCRLDMGTTAYNHKNFARAAKKILVEIDPEEIRKLKMDIELPVQGDLRAFLGGLVERKAELNSTGRESWLARSQGWKEKYPIVLPEHRAVKDRISTYVFADVLSDQLAPDEVIVPTSSGLCCEIFYLAFRVQMGQRLYHNRGTGSMGFAVPSSIGACVAAGRRRTICIEGDGGLQMNIQELQSISRENLPIKLFILNNNGYASIRLSQRKYFNRLVGADPTSGMTFPDLEKLCAAYGLHYVRMCNHDDLERGLRGVLDRPGPVLCEVMVEEEETRQPGIASRQLADGSMVSSPLEDLWPFLDREEFLSNMIIPPLEN